MPRCNDFILSARGLTKGAFQIFVFCCLWLPAPGVKAEDSGQIWGATVQLEEEPSPPISGPGSDLATGASLQPGVQQAVTSLQVILASGAVSSLTNASVGLTPPPIPVSTPSPAPNSPDLASPSPAPAASPAPATSPPPIAVGPTNPAVQLASFPAVRAPQFSLSAVEQRVNVSGSQSNPAGYRGNLTLVGTLANSSWFINLRQPNLRDALSWQIAELQFQRQTNQTDYLLGSQPLFWSRQRADANDFWGLTLIHRQGYAAPVQLSGGGPQPRQRLAAQDRGTISGRADPGTLVRLTQGIGDQIIAETVVDSSGNYRFRDVETRGSVGGNYRLLLYPRGELTAQPDIRDVTFSATGGKIPAGASAWVFSAGLRREFSGDQPSLLGNFPSFRGGVSRRWGLSNNLTIGVGALYDRQLRGLAELFFQSPESPLEVAVTAMPPSGDLPWFVNSEVRFEPSSKLRARFLNEMRGDEGEEQLASRLEVDWQIFPGITLSGSMDSQDVGTAGILFSFNRKNSSTFLRLNLDTENRFRWNLTQRLGRMELSSRGNDVSSSTELTYGISQDNSPSNRHALVLSYETRDQDRSDRLAAFSWRYRSPQRTIDNQVTWEARVGYGIGSRGTGIVASVQTALIPGILIRARYQGASLTSDEPTFNVELISNLDLQRGLTGGDRRLDRFRTQGGVLVQMFLDQNRNGRFDPGEEALTDKVSLLTLNEQPMESFRPEQRGDRMVIRLPPGIHRVAIQPDSLPAGWQIQIPGYQIEVVAGSYTPILVPLVPQLETEGIGAK